MIGPRGVAGRGGVVAAAVILAAAAAQLPRHEGQLLVLVEAHLPGRRPKSNPADSSRIHILTSS